MASLNISLPEKVDTQDPEALQKLNSYLYKLSEEIRYMFGNLTPEDNYSSEAYVKFIQSADAQAKMEVSLKQIELSYVTKDNIISSINLSSEGVKIKGKNIYLEGAITANVDSQGNPTFSVDENGFIHASGGSFKGDISASNISGSTITGSHIYSSYYGTTADDFYITAVGNVTVVGINGFTFENKLMYSDWIGSIANPATDGDDTSGLNGRTGDAGFRKLYLLDDWYEGSDGTMWDVTRTLKWLDNRIAALESSCTNDCSDSSDDCIGDGCDCNGEFSPDGPVESC